MSTCVYCSLPWGCPPQGKALRKPQLIQAQDYWCPFVCRLVSFSAIQVFFLSMLSAGLGIMTKAGSGIPSERPQSNHQVGCDLSRTWSPCPAPKTRSGLSFLIHVCLKHSERYLMLIYPYIFSNMGYCTMFSGKLFTSWSVNAPCLPKYLIQTFLIAIYTY